MEQYSSSPSRAAQLWQHMAGMFGADAIKRKFGAQPPNEWESALSQLTDAQLRNGVEKLLRSGAEHVPALPQFLVMCHTAREFEDHSTLKRIEGTQFDTWGIAANFHLLAYVRTAAGNKRYFNPEQTGILVQFKNAWAEDMRADDKGEGIPIEKQKAAWKDCLQRAEAAMA